MRKRRGAIVTMSSVVGVHGNAGQTNYAASKGGVIALTKALAKELGSRNVRVNCIAPGYVTTELTDVLPDAGPRAILAADAARPPWRPRRRRARLRFLLSDAAAYVTGAVVPVDGGMGMCMERRRVVVTGIGRGQRVGLNVEEFAEGLRAGRSGGGPITRFDASDAPARIACEVKGFDPTTVLDRKTARRTDRYAHLAVAAAREAVADAQLEIAPEADRIGASIGSGIGGLDTLYTAHEHIFTKHSSTASRPSGCRP